MNKEQYDEAVQLVYRATAHNYGQVVERYQMWGNNVVLVQVGSWPRAREAQVLLEKNGFIAHIRKPTDGSPGEVLEITVC